MGGYDEGMVLDSQWELIEQIGRGGFGTVFRARNLIDGDEYALKLLEGGSAERVSRELRRIDCPNVVKMHWAGKLTDGTWWLATEFVHGRELEEVIETESPISIDDVYALGSQLLTALLVIHPDEERIAELQDQADLSEDEYQELEDLQATGIVHRDIKPSNLLVAKGGRLVLVDFGISSRAGTRHLTHSFTQGYLPPDFDWRRWEPDVDRYAAGVVLYRVACLGAFPYDDAIDSDEPEDPLGVRPGLPAGLAEFLRTACAASRDDRFPSTVEMVRAWIGEIGRFKALLQEQRSGRADEDEPGGDGEDNEPARLGWTTDDQLRDAIVDLVHSNGPIVCADLYRLVRATTDEWIPTDRLNRLVFKLVRNGQRIKQVEPLGGGQQDKTVYAAHADG